jgi:hypothetical protein
VRFRFAADHELEVDVPVRETQATGSSGVCSASSWPISVFLESDP